MNEVEGKGEVSVFSTEPISGSESTTELLNELIVDEPSSIDLHFMEIRQFTHPELKEQLELGKKIQHAKLWLYALHQLDRASLPTHLQDEILSQLEDPKRRFLAQSFVSPASPENREDISVDDKNHDEEKGEDLTSVVTIGEDPASSLQEQIRNILNIEIPEDREIELSKLWEGIKGDIQVGVVSHEELVLRNAKLVIALAQKYKSKRWGMEDLLGEGYIGLNIAASQYDPRKGFRFSTYAYHLVRKHMRKSIVEKSRTIRIPDHTHWGLIRVYNGKSENTVSENILSQASKIQFVDSLDRPIGEGEGTLLGSLIVDKNAVQPENIALVKEKKVRIAKILDRLPERERFVLVRKFGFEGHEACTLAEIGRELGLTRERVRQIEARAFKRILDEEGSHELVDFMD